MSMSNNYVTLLPSRTQAEAHLSDLLTKRIRTELANERIVRQQRGIVEPSMDDEVAIARAIIAEERHRGPDDGAVAYELDVEDFDRIADAVIAGVLGLGRLQRLLEDPDISDIHVRGSYPVWVKWRNGTRTCVEPIVDSDEELVELIRRAATRLVRNEQRFDAANPELNLQLPDGSRLFATMAVSQHPSLIVRRHRFDISSLDELHDRGMFDDEIRAFLSAAVLARRNIVIAGGTGSGKTTLLRALLNEVPPIERIVTIEDAYELGIERFGERHPDHDALQSRVANVEGRGAVTMADLTKMALRMDPDRVIVGEVRGAEAFPMLMAMSQGNNGSMCTMHADSTRSVFPKLAAYVSMASTGLPVDTVNLIVSSAIHFVVYVENSTGVRRVRSIREVVDTDGLQIISNEVFSATDDGPCQRAYPLRDKTAALLEAHGYQPQTSVSVRQWGAQ
jgi:Flp pilus assembly CpaF family ATPase